MTARRTKPQRTGRSLTIVDDDGRPRPMTRGDCGGGPVDGAGPCNVTRCAYWLPSIEASCVLDAADDGPMTLHEVSRVLGITREGVRQIEMKALAKIRGSAAVRSRGVLDDLLDVVRERENEVSNWERYSAGDGGRSMNGAAEKTKRRTPHYGSYGRSVSPDEQLAERLSDRLALRAREREAGAAQEPLGAAFVVYVPPLGNVTTADAVAVTESEEIMESDVRKIEEWIRHACADGDVLTGTESMEACMQQTGVARPAVMFDALNRMRCARKITGDFSSGIRWIDAPPKAKPPKAKLPKAKLPKAKLPKAKLPKAKLPKAKLPKAKLPKAKLPKAKVMPASPHDEPTHYPVPMTLAAPSRYPIPPTSAPPAQRSPKTVPPQPVDEVDLEATIAARRARHEKVLSDAVAQIAAYEEIAADARKGLEQCARLHAALKEP